MPQRRILSLQAGVPANLYLNCCIMGRVVIVVYRPFEGRQKELENLVRSHVDLLRNENLVTDRKPVIMRASDGCVVEIFEWKSKESIQEAHGNESVNRIWEKFNEVCNYEKPVNLTEFNDMFSEFEAID
jgi:hypothetical protein